MESAIWIFAGISIEFGLRIVSKQTTRAAQHTHTLLLYHGICGISSSTRHRSGTAEHCNSATYSYGTLIRYFKHIVIVMDNRDLFAPFEKGLVVLSQAETTVKKRKLDLSSTSNVRWLCPFLMEAHQLKSS